MHETDLEMMHEYSLHSLKERAKELNCLYQVDEILNNERLSISEMAQGIVHVIPSGWQYPEYCAAQIVIEQQSFQTESYCRSRISESSPIKVDERVVGSIEVVYTRQVPGGPEGFFLDKERKLIHTIAERIGQTIFHRRLKQVMQEWSRPRMDLPESAGSDGQWTVILDLLRRTDPEMLLNVSRKMTNHLYVMGVGEAESLLHIFSPGWQEVLPRGEVNYPSARMPLGNVSQICERVYHLASRYLSDKEITMRLNRWIQEQKAYDLIKIVGRIDTSLGEIVEAIRRFGALAGDSSMLYTAAERWLEVALIHRFLSDNLDFIRVAKQYIGINHFYGVVDRLIFPPESHGKVGGKSTGLFLAQQILKAECANYPFLASIRVPKTWCITTDALTEFLHYNNLEGLNEQKYKDLLEIRMEYPNIIQMLKNAHFPPGIIKDLAMALDDFGDVPLIVRSSSLLEDQMGAAFSGKYKSLFLANRGSKKERLDALVGAIVEVYASIFSPDSIRYRAERGLLDFQEEMGILIQRVVGRQIGPYFMPLYAGVAVSNNEFRWSPRIKREDGLIRLVMGMGTRAVDRLADDFPVLVSPGQPNLRVNTVPEEIVHYSPKMVDVINLEQNRFECVAIDKLLKQYGPEIPAAPLLLGVYREGCMQAMNPFLTDYNKDQLVVNFDGLIGGTPFIKQVGQILKVLQEKLGAPVDIEFASDGKDFYLLQCRPQGYGDAATPAPVPRDLNDKQIVFNARRYVSNGMVQNISHIVYVDPLAYSQLGSLEELVDVGKAVGMLNMTLPRRRFILMGPGRWGSRGEIKMGVQVSYADINNTAALIEIGRRKSNYVPELSFGTHFFQDLVEANIRYLPLYPDDEGIIFDERFLTRSANILAQVLPQYEGLEEVIRVIDVPESSGGRFLHLNMNADLEEAVGYLDPLISASPGENGTWQPQASLIPPGQYRYDDSFWRWRQYMAEQLARRIDAQPLGVIDIYLIGSTNSGTAGPGSDIDLIIHFRGDEEQRIRLQQWLDGWSQALAEINYLKTGYFTDRLLDVHIVTDEDIAMKKSFAAKIGAFTDPALKLSMG